MPPGRGTRAGPVQSAACLESLLCLIQLHLEKLLWLLPHSLGRSQVRELKKKLRLGEVS